MKTFLTPEIGMGIKIPRKKDPNKKLIMRFALGLNLMDDMDYKYWDKDLDEEDQEDDHKDWSDYKESYPYGLNVKIDFGFNRSKNN